MNKYNSTPVSTRRFKRSVLTGVPDMAQFLRVKDPPRAVIVKRMVEEVENLGADAIVTVRYRSASAMQSAAEVMAYDTAVNSNEGSEMKKRLKKKLVNELLIMAAGLIANAAYVNKDAILNKIK